MQEDNPSPEEFAKRMAEASKTAAEKLVEEVQPVSTDEVIAHQREEIASLEDKLLRTMAEMQNLRRRTEKDVEEARKFGITSFARDLINVLENLRRADDSIPKEELEKNELFRNLQVGVHMTHQELVNICKRHGINQIDPLGQKFDHNLHQAMMEIPTDEAEPGTVMQVMQAGYTIYDRLLRPALVALAKSMPEQPKPESAAAEDTAVKGRKKKQG